LRTRIKKYRSSGKGIIYKTISLTLNENVMRFIIKETQKTEHKNMSRFIEEIIFGSVIEGMPKRRAFKSFPVKKTFTFTEEFVTIIRRSGNMSLFIESVLNKKFNI